KPKHQEDHGKGKRSAVHEPRGERRSEQDDRDKGDPQEHDDFSAVRSLAMREGMEWVGTTQRTVQRHLSSWVRPTEIVLGHRRPVAGCPSRERTFRGRGSPDLI